MRRLFRFCSKWPLALALTALVLAGCGGAQATPSPTIAPTSPAVTSTPVPTNTAAKLTNTPLPPTSTVASSAVERLTLQPCKVSPPGSTEQIEARCGTLKVYENRAANTGRQLGLNIVVLPAKDAQPQPDPLFMLAGGPGGDATGSYLGLAGVLAHINRHRDIVLVDQRGTGKSNPLNCDLPPDMWDLPDEQLTGAARHCLKSLDAGTVYYTTENAVADFDDVRQALGYGKVNLYGGSYGTRAALTYLHMFPQNVRAIVLDGIVPQDYAISSDASASGQRSLEILLDRCEADADCSKAFPGVRSELEDLASRLDSAPEGITIHLPTTGGSTPYQLKRYTFSEYLRIMLYNRYLSASVPLLVHTAHVQNSFEPFAEPIALIQQQIFGALSKGLFLSVICSEDVPYYESPDVGGVDDGIFAGIEWPRVLKAYCTGWPKGETSSWFKQPVTSDVPALLISGEADPVTPPAFGDQVARTLPNSLHLVIAGGGHGNLATGCMPQVAAFFLEAGSAEGLDTSCASRIEPVGFELSAP